MDIIEKKFEELYGELNLTPNDAAFRVFKSGWNCAKQNFTGLTKDDVDSWTLLESPTIYEFAKYVESKIKEKNSEG